MDVRVKFGESGLNSGWVARHFAGRTHFTHFCAAFNYICNRPEAAGDVVYGTFMRPIRLYISERCVKFRYPRLNRSPEIQPEAVVGGIFWLLFELR